MVVYRRTGRGRSRGGRHQSSSAVRVFHNFFADSAETGTGPAVKPESYGVFEMKRLGALSVVVNFRGDQS